MEILAKVGAAFQRLFGPVVEEAAAKTKVIQRRREFSPVSLAMTFVLGHLWKPNAAPHDLAVMALKAKTAVSPQAVDQRRTQVLADFLEEVFRGCVKVVVTSSQALA